MAWMQRIEKLKRDFTDKYVVVDATRPELQRFRDFTGCVKTVNMSGRALVEFGEDNNIGWYDIELDYLKVVDKPKPKEPDTKAKKASPAKKATPAKATGGEKKLSPLEMARMADSKKTGDSGKADTGKKLPPLEMARMADSKKGGAKAPTAKSTSSDTTKPAQTSTSAILEASRNKQGMSIAEILSASRTNPKGSPAATSATVATTQKEKPKTTSGNTVDRSNMSVAEMLAAARAEKNNPTETAITETQGTETQGTPTSESAAPEVAQPSEESIASESTPATSNSPSSELPTETASMIAYCREHDGN